MKATSAVSHQTGLHKAKIKNNLYAKWPRDAMLAIWKKEWWSFQLYVNRLSQYNWDMKSIRDFFSCKHNFFRRQDLRSRNLIVCQWFGEDGYYYLWTSIEVAFIISLGISELLKPAEHLKMWNKN